MLIEPRRQFDQVPATSTLPKTSTQREPYTFKIVKQASQTRANPKCSRYHTQGHSISSKACPLRYAYLISPSASTAPPNMLPPSTTPSSAQQPVPNPSLCSILPQQQVALPAALSDQEMVPSPPDIIALPSSSADIPPPPDMPPSVPASGPDIRYNDPHAIYDRYVTARMAWYNKLPRGSLKTNQEYRKAIGLP